MLPEQLARAWLAHAEGDLALASVQAPAAVPLELLCFHAQQAAEKALKAFLLAHGESPPRTHDIGVLVEQVEAIALVPPSLRAAASLTEYAVATRYPGDAEPVTPRDLAAALSHARAVLEAVRRQIGG